TVVHNMCLIWSKRSTCVSPEARVVVSESGDILSPKYAPETTAPAIIAGLISMLSPIPIPATPTVAMVDQELPITTEIIEQINKIVTKKYVGLISCKP